MKMDKVSFINYNKFYYKSANELMNFYMYSDNDYLRSIVKNILIYKKYIDDSISKDKMIYFIDNLKAEELWSYCTTYRDEKGIFYELAFSKLMNLLDDIEAKYNRSFFKVLK